MGTELGINRRAEDRPLKEPRVGGSVWPRQRCPAFTPRAAVLPVEKLSLIHISEPTRP